MTIHNLRVLVAAVLLVFLPATTIPAPITAQARLAPAAFDCITVTAIPLVECQALVALYNSTNGTGWTNQSGWLITDTPCSWYGITCDTGHVVELDVHSNQLSGSIPSELGNLASLQELMLWANQLSGSIPPELGNLANLQNLDLNGNQLNVSIPAQLGNLANLRYLKLGHNQLSGSIPHELGNLANLQELTLWSNLLSGSIPSELGNLANLDHLRLDSNQLRGLLPQSLTSLHVLAYFYYDTDLLCAPGNFAFQTWLAGITEKPQDVKTCKTCYLSVLMR